MKTTRNKTISLCVAAVVLVAGTVWAGNGVWTEHSGMQTGRDQFTGCVIGDEIFVFGGNDPTGYNLYSGEKYHIATDTWSSIADNPQGVEELTGVELDGKFYVFGGWGGFDDPINGYYGVFNFNQMYDPATNTWTTLARKPTTTSSSVAAVYEGKIYLFGGYYSDESLTDSIAYKTVEAYDPVEDKWEFVTEMPLALSNMAVAVHGNHAYLIGGVDWDEGVVLDEVMAYDFETGVWIRDYCRVPSDVVRVYSYAGPAPVLDGKVYLAGGIEGTLKKHKASNKFTIFDIASKQWVSGPVLPEPRQSSLTVLSNNAIYVIGGSVKGSDDARNTVFAYEIDDSMTLDITKFTAAAGKSPGTDRVQFSGIMQTGAHVMAAGQIIVSLDAADMPVPLEWTFPINASTFKKGTFSGKSGNSSFRYSVKTGKMVFSANNEDLTGLACPLTVTITIGDVSESIELDEDIVNGTKKPCPPQFLMGVRNWMAVDKAQVKFGKSSGTDSLTITGFFTIGDDYHKSNPVRIMLGGQTFTVSGDQFKAGNFSESCTNAVSDEGPLVKAKFDFAKCTFQIQVSNAVINDAGDVAFGLDCFGNELPEEDISIIAPSAARYELERYRCYDQFGRRWTYSANYSIRDSEDMTNSSGTTTGTVSVANTPVYKDGNPCFSVRVSTPDSTVSSAWYEDYYGMRLYTWGNANDMVSFDANMDALLAVPKLLAVGQTHKTSGSFSGNFDLDLGYSYMDLDISDFKGTASIETTLLDFEPVTVPYEKYNNAAKVRIKQTLNGSMMVEVDYYGQILRARLKFQAVMNQTWWGVEDMGVVKIDSDMLIKMSGGGENIWVSMTETDRLTGYIP